MSATVGRRVLRLETTARLRGGAAGALCDDERLALLHEAGLIGYDDHRVVVADDAPDEVRRWLAAHAPDGYIVV